MTPATSPPPASFRKLFLRGFSWTFAQSTGGLLVQVATLAILSRLLTPLDFGIVAVAVSVVGVISLVVELGVGPALIQHRSLNPRHVGSAIWLSLAMAVALMVLSQSLAPLVAGWLGIGDKSAVLRFLCLIIILQPLTTILSSLARRDLAMKEMALANLIGSTLGYSLVAVVLALYGLGYWALAIAQITQLLVTFLLLLSSQFSRLSFRIGRRETREILDFGFFFSIGRLANYGAQKFDRALVGGFLGLEAAGNYQRVLNMLQLIGPLAAGPLDAILFPLLSKLQDDAARLRRSYRATTCVAALLTMPASVMMCVTAPVLVVMILGSQWTGVVLPAQIMAGMLFFRTNDSITATMVRAVGRVKERAILQILYAFLSLSSIYLLKDFGLAGVAWGLLGVTVLNFILMSFLVRRVALMTLGDNFTPLLPGMITAGSLAGLALVFYLPLGAAFFSFTWIGLYILASAVLFALLLAVLPASLFPSEIGGLRAALWRNMQGYLLDRRPKSAAAIGGQ